MKNFLLLILLLPALSHASGWVRFSGGGFTNPCYRYEVPHGWLINCDGAHESSIAYYPDETHEWRI